MKFDWKNWNIGGKVIFVAACVATASMLMKWVDVGFVSQSGLSQGAFLYLGLWVYPVLMLFKNKSIHRVWGVVCSSASVVSTLIYISSKSVEIFDETVNAAATGAYLFLFASIGLIVGTIKYRAVIPVEKGEPSMTESQGTTPRPPPSTSTQAPALWNPNAAINWSVLFSPIFGGLIHAKNWEALGEQEKATTSRRWAWAGIAVFVVALFMKDAGSVPGLIYLIAWYFIAGRKQAARVKELYGTSYSRKPWGKVLGIASGILIGVVIVLGIAGALSGDGGEYEE